MRVAIVFAISLGVFGCTKERTFKQAMKLYCDAPNRIESFTSVGAADRAKLLHAWVAKNIKEKGALNVAAALEDATPTDRARELARVAKEEAGLDSCPLALVSGPIVPGSPATVSSATEDLDSDLVLVAVGRHELFVEGQPLMAIKDGRVNASELEGGALGLTINKLEGQLKGLAQQPEFRAPEIYTFFDRMTPFETVFKVVGTVSKTGFKKPIFLVARADGELSSIPLTIPDTSAAGAIEGPETPPDARPLQLVVSVTNDRKVILWSITGLEGTLQEPKLVTNPREGSPPDDIDVAPIQTALFEIVTRRWKGRQRPNTTKEIIVQLDAKLPFQVVANVIASVRVAKDNTELFPDVLLSSGFQ